MSSRPPLIDEPSSDSASSRPSPEDAQQTLDAIASGEVDAVVVHGPNGPQVYRLEGPDRPFQTFVERMQEGALSLAADGTIRYANTYFGRLVGRAPEDLVGSRFSDLVAPEYGSTVAGLIRDGIHGTVKGHAHLVGTGGTISVQLTLSPLPEGAEPSCCAVVFDLREREGAEAAHTALLAAEQASNAKDRFLAVLSHELRSPLNVILGWAQVLNNDATLGETSRRAVETIERNSRAQAQLIGDLLDISRIIAGKLHLEMAPLDLRALVEAAVVGSRPSAELAKLELHFVAVGEPSVHGDATRIQQIVGNLLNNAIKFSSPGGRIHVELKLEGATAILRVSDTGAGMSSTLLPHVFDVFHQGAGRNTKGGLGLGLAIAKQLTDAHSGSLSASSDGEGCGSTFELVLPVTTRVERPAGPGFSPRGELDGLVILIVDDEQDNLDLSRFLLESAGAVVETAASAQEALAALGARAFGLVVSDIGLPGQDGLDLMREVRARGFEAASLPAIALTGYAGLHDSRLVRAAGYQHHLSKPVDAALLLRTVAELGRKR